MRLHDASVYSVISRFLHDLDAPVFLDVGANRGDECRAILRDLPRAVVHAFEPSPRCQADLGRVAEAMPGVRVHQVAVGASNGRTTLIETRNDLLSSTLPVNAVGRSHLGVNASERGRTPVDIVSLDTWAAAQGVARVDCVKIDVQGAELGVLQGAERLLRECVRAVYSEAQILPEYEGAATLTDLDIFLRERGFVLHQIHEVRTRGPERQTCDVDALWVRADSLAALRDRFAAQSQVPASTMAQALKSVASRGVRRLAIYGVGPTTRQAASALFDPPVEIVCLADDSRARGPRRLLGFPVVDIADVDAEGVDAVLLSPDGDEHEMACRAAECLPNTVRVLRPDGEEVARETLVKANR